MKAQEARVTPSRSTPTESDITETVRLAVSPVHKAALGTATGIVAGLVVAALTLFVVVLNPEPRPPLGLLANYFYGYTVTPAGAAVGFAWAFAVGFVAGWFVAFVRNFTTAVWLFFVRTRAQFSRNFLDHI